MIVLIIFSIKKILIFILTLQHVSMDLVVSDFKKNL